MESREPVRFLLDTNVLSHLIRYPAGPVAKRLQGMDEGSIITSVVVACELRYGAARKGSAALSERVDQLLENIEVVPLGPGADRTYARIRHGLEAKGQLIGSNDLLIAAHALEQDATLVTDNVSEFERVPGLRVENWSR